MSAPFSRLVDVGALPAEGLRVTVSPTDAERAELARTYGLLELPKLEADLHIMPWGPVGVRADGRLRADVVQACVVSLEPVAQSIDERFTRTFLPPEAMEKEPTTVAEAEVLVAYDEDDPPEPLEGRTIDLGAIVSEHLALAIDPYPRAAGAKLPEGLDINHDSPFAALSKLKAKPDDGA